MNRVVTTTVKGNYCLFMTYDFNSNVQDPLYYLNDVIGLIPIHNQTRKFAIHWFPGKNIGGTAV